VHFVGTNAFLAAGGGCAAVPVQRIHHLRLKEIDPQNALLSLVLPSCAVNLVGRNALQKYMLLEEMLFRTSFLGKNRLLSTFCWKKRFFGGRWWTRRRACPTDTSPPARSTLS